MTAAHEKLYLRTLHALVAAGVDFCVIGTFALRQHCPALPRRQVADCDIMLPPAADVLNKLVRQLQAVGWQVMLWETAVSGPLSIGQLVGKYYLRARQAGAVLDCAYENDFWDWPGFAAHRQWQHGLPLLAPAQVLWQKQQSARPADRAAMPLLQKLLAQPSAKKAAGAA